MKSNSENYVQKLLGRNVKRLRKENKLTQEELSEKLGITQKHLSIIETGTQFASATLIAKISEIFETPVSELFTTETTESNYPNFYKMICTHIDTRLTELYEKIEGNL